MGTPPNAHHLLESAMLVGRALLVSAAMARRAPHLTVRRAGGSVTMSEPGAFVKTVWSEMTASGQSKDAAKIDEVFDKYFKPSCTLIRPSGNPLDRDGFKGMLGSPDIIVEKDEVASIDEVKELAGGQAAVVTYTTLSKFSYKGTPNDDVAKFSATLEKAESGEWKMAHLHRGTGQKAS